MNNYALALNENGFDDLFLYKGQIARVTGNDQIAQRVKTLLRTFMGEFFLDQTFGIPYYQQIFTKPANIAVIDSIIKNAILSVNGVVKIKYFNSDIDSSRTYTVSTIILDEAGNEIDISLPLGG